LDGLVFAEPVMRLAAGYLRRFYEFDEIRRWPSPNHEPPEWFDHRANLYRFSSERVPYWVERGVYARELMSQGCQVLDLCCGDGFYAFHFYAETASHVDALDRDEDALAHARRWHSHPNIAYHKADLVTDELPSGEYDVVVWDAAIEHFTLEDQRAVLRKIKAALAPDGVLAGYTLISAGSPGHPKHEHEFGNPAELHELLREEFPHVATLETVYPSRHNIYFRAASTEQKLGGFS
jgi:SAM-dependent methyltransferase